MTIRAKFKIPSLLYSFHYIDLEIVTIKFTFHNMAATSNNTNKNYHNFNDKCSICWFLERINGERIKIHRICGLFREKEKKKRKFRLSSFTHSPPPHLHTFQLINSIFSLTHMLSIWYRWLENNWIDICGNMLVDFDVELNILSEQEYVCECVNVCKCVCALCVRVVCKPCLNRWEM